MAGVVFDAGHALDDTRHPRQRPQLGAESLRRGPRAERALDCRQFGGTESGLAARAPRGLQAPPAIGLPGLMPVIGRGRGHAQRLRHGRLRLAAREQPRGFEPPSFQRSKILSGSAAGRGHESA